MPWLKKLWYSLHSGWLLLTNNIVSVWNNVHASGKRMQLSLTYWWWRLLLFPGHLPWLCMVIWTFPLLMSYPPVASLSRQCTVTIIKKPSYMIFCVRKSSWGARCMLFTRWLKEVRSWTIKIWKTVSKHLKRCFPNIRFAWCMGKWKRRTRKLKCRNLLPAKRRYWWQQLLSR